MTIQESMDILQKKEAFECLPTGCSEKDVQAIEAKLKIALPESYRQFVLTYGYVLWFGHTILGVSPSDSDYDAVVRTEKMRKTPLPRNSSRIPAEGLVIMKYGGGGNYFLFTKGHPREGQVALFSDDNAGNEAEHWITFEDFVTYFAKL